MIFSILIISAAVFGRFQLRFIDCKFVKRIVITQLVGIGASCAVSFKTEGYIIFTFAIIAI
jgi:hypothetical protein